MAISHLLNRRRRCPSSRRRHRMYAVRQCRHHACPPQCLLGARVSTAFAHTSAGPSACLASWARTTYCPVVLKSFSELHELDFCQRDCRIHRDAHPSMAIASSGCNGIWFREWRIRKVYNKLIGRHRGMQSVIAWLPALPGSLFVSGFWPGDVPGGGFRSQRRWRAVDDGRAPRSPRLNED